MEELKPFISKVAEGRDLSQDEAQLAFDHLASGRATPSQIGALLMGLRVKGEAIDEIAGAVTAMRSRMVTVDAPAGSIDVVGTGGDASYSYNISTCAAFIVAGAGVPVAKHGNRAISSRCGAADVLSALGVKVSLGPVEVARCIEEAGIGFMFAPAHHPALKHVSSARREIGTRTVFNLLGPLLNPAGVRYHLIGVYAQQWTEPVAAALARLGSHRALVVCGYDGLDELTTAAETKVTVLEDGQVHSLVVTPEDAGLPRAVPASIVGGDAEHNADALRRVLHNEPSPYRDVAVLNAAGALWAAGVVTDLRRGAEVASDVLAAGKAQHCLEALVVVSNAGVAGAETVPAERQFEAAR